MAPPLEDVRPKFELKDRNYIVTGGAQGIGFAYARAICEMGVGEYKTLSSKFGVKIAYIKTVTIEESLNLSFAEAIKFLMDWYRVLVLPSVSLSQNGLRLR